MLAARRAVVKCACQTARSRNIRSIVAPTPAYAQPDGYPSTLPCNLRRKTTPHSRRCADPRGLLDLHDQETAALIDGAGLNRIELPLTQAWRRRVQAKRAFLFYGETHGC